MCGIAGVLRFDNNHVDCSSIHQMAKSIRHRGPDGIGCFIDGGVGIAHTRLAIIDLSKHANQPMQDEGCGLVISFNGEIYNFLEIKKELEKRGHKFKSRSDTEVILASWLEWGVDCISKFNGMFAFSIFDRKEKCVYICRDRYGIKPVYYYRDHSIFIFGSESKSILAYGHVRPEVDKEAILEYFTFQNLLTDKTFFRNIHLLPPGSYLKVNSVGDFNVVKWWDYSFEEPESRRSKADYVDELDFLFNRAIKRQLVSDVPVASYLSGGIDSGAISAVASRELQEMRTFTVGFDLNSVSGLELSMDERKPAEEMSSLFESEHYQMVLKAGDMVRALPKMTAHIEEPRVGQSYPNFYAAQLASKFNKVVLAGTGGDELFAGYPWRYYRATVHSSFDDYVDAYYTRWHRLIPNKEVQNVFSPIWEDIKHVWTRDIFKSIFGDQPRSVSCPEDFINLSLYFEASTFLHGLLVVEDKLAMAHGLETRVPFLDNDLVDFAMKVPVSMKLGNLGEVSILNENETGRKSDRFFQDTKDGKLLLREVLARYVPSSIASRRKQGFSAPDASWFRGQSIEYVKSIIYSPNSKIYDYLNNDAVQRLVSEHLEGKVNRRLFIWSLLVFENWLWMNSL